MTLYSGDPKISVLHYRLVWKSNFILPFGLGPDFILPFPAAAEENLGFIVGIFYFLTEKVNSYSISFFFFFFLHRLVWDRFSYYRSAWDRISYYRPRIFWVR
jgi:hypothetical protein